MDFGNPDFLVLLAGLVLVHWVLPRSMQLYWMVLAPVALLVWEGHFVTLAFLICLTPLCYFAASTTTQAKKAPVASAVIFLCLVFLAYKLVQSLWKTEDSVFVLLGVSYFLLKMIHYLVESSNAKLQKHSFTELAAYLFFAPTLLVGPINRFPEFIRDERRRRWDAVLFHSGLERILFGYFKVIVVANYLLGTKLSVFIEQQGGDATAFGAWLNCLEYGLDLYFRFSGYCDIAIGVSALLGFRIIENFNYPFIRSNISEFWRSWHISLSNWCRDYVFTPVAFKLRWPALGVVASMLILGLWHELSWRYIIWGLYHGLGIVIFQQWSRIKTTLPGYLVLPGVVALPLAIALTFNFVILSFALTRTETLTQAWLVYRTIFGGG
jgi:alginate O-acetyltransferase complex protein AlgI